MFPHCNVHKYTLIDKRWDASIFGAPYFRGADSNIDHYLVVAKFRGETVSRQMSGGKVRYGEI
jgi:hypothetical protein